MVWCKPRDKGLFGNLNGLAAGLTADADRDAVKPLARGHIPALDGVRGMAILMVLIFHGWIAPVRSAVDDYLARAAGFGWCGVDLFFVLSGFLITGILYDAKGSAHYFRNFYARRFFRIFPLYYAALVLGFYLTPAFFRVTDHVQNDQWWFWTYLSNFWLASHAEAKTALTVTWSLAIEEQFYLVWPLLVCLLGRASLMRLCVATVLLAFAARCLLMAGGYEPAVARFVTICRLDTMAAGGFLALLVRKPNGAAVIASYTRIIAAAAAAAVLAVAVLQKGFSENGWLMITLGQTALAIGYAALLAVAISASDGSATVRFFESKPFRVLGKYSYSIYLFHMPLNLWISDHIWGRQQMQGGAAMAISAQLVFYALSVGSSLAVAVVTWNLYEKWFLMLKKYFPVATSQTSDGQAHTTAVIR